MSTQAPAPTRSTGVIYFDYAAFDPIPIDRPESPPLKVDWHVRDTVDAVVYEVGSRLRELDDTERSILLYELQDLLVPPARPYHAEGSQIEFRGEGSERIGILRSEDVEGAPSDPAPLDALDDWDF